MLYYVKIGNFEGVDYPEGQDYAGKIELKSTQCICCLFYFYCRMNFQFERYICNVCFHCVQYEKANSRMLFVVNMKKGTFRTVSDYFLVEIEELLEKRDLNNRFGWLYKDESSAANEVKARSSCVIESQSLK